MTLEEEEKGSVEGKGKGRMATKNMVSQDYYTISSKTKTGFTITFYNSSSSAQNRTFDYVAKGYGLKS